jgi:hypothetical protein
MQATTQQVNLPTRLQHFLSSKISIRAIVCAIKVESAPHDDLLRDSAHITRPLLNPAILNRTPAKSIQVGRIHANGAGGHVVMLTLLWLDKAVCSNSVIEQPEGSTQSTPKPVK